MAESRIVGSYDDYRDAARAAEFLAAQGLDAGRIRIDGEDLRPVTAPRSLLRRLVQAAAAAARRPGLEAARYTVVIDRAESESRLRPGIKG
jgi:hypothetical protein